MSKENAGHYQEAMELLEALVESQKREQPSEDLASSGLMNDLAVAYFSAGKIDKAIETSKQVYELRKLDRDRKQTIVAGYNYVKCLAAKAAPSEVVAEYEKLLAESRQHFGDDHFQTLRLIRTLGSDLPGPTEDSARS